MLESCRFGVGLVLANNFLSCHLVDDTHCYKQSETRVSLLSHEISFEYSSADTIHSYKWLCSWNRTIVFLTLWYFLAQLSNLVVIFMQKSQTKRLAQLFTRPSSWLPKHELLPNGRARLRLMKWITNILSGVSWKMSERASVGSSSVAESISLIWLTCAH